MPIEQTKQRLAYLLDKIPIKFGAIDDNEFYYKPAENKWSKLEILGHLIDSAANNWQRFVRIQFEDDLFLVYDQDNWNIYSYYQQAAREDILKLWVTLNRHLLFIMNNIPEDKLGRTGRSNEPEPVTLEFLIDDYVAHMEHHLKQIFPQGY